jgi:hypothetical protein
MTASYRVKNVVSVPMHVLALILVVDLPAEEGFLDGIKYAENYSSNA